MVLSVLEDVLDTGLAAILPVYEGGNVTKLIASDGTEFIEKRTCRTVLKNIARLYGADLAAIRKRYGRQINKKHVVPIPFGSNLVLIPIKVRERPLGENDGTLGYINFRDISRVEEAGGGASYITLKGGTDVHALVSCQTVREYMKNALLVESLYIATHFQGCAPAVENAHTVKEGGSTAKYGGRILRLKNRRLSPVHREQAEGRYPRKSAVYTRSPEFLPPPDGSQQTGGCAGESAAPDDEALLRAYLAELLFQILLMQKNRAES
ncbi:hypothetical protein [Thermoanaerobacterium sp. DL9XJH110]|uniref:hypothetical protein n=1 Tax=Thermoanaerobacterium sp. DL9XJH110 TaxID=3386643 RepID=UPI003BB58F24